MLTLFENAAPDELKSLASIDLQRALMTVRVQWRDATAHLPLIEHMREGIEAHIPEGFEARPTGSVYMASTVVGQLLSDLLTSFGTAAAVITVLMVLMLRELKLGLLAMLPNLLPIATVMGYMGLQGIALDTNTLMLGSVAIGIVVDDTIHFLHQFKVYYDEHGDTEGAIRHTFLHTGRAMTITSVILVLGFMCVMVSELNSSIMFGYLMALTVIAALAFDFAVTPAILRWAYPPRSLPPAVDAPAEAA